MTDDEANEACLAVIAATGNRLGKRTIVFPDLYVASYDQESPAFRVWTKLNPGDHQIYQFEVVCIPFMDGKDTIFGYYMEVSLVVLGGCEVLHRYPLGTDISGLPTILANRSRFVLRLEAYLAELQL